MVNYWCLRAPTIPLNPSIYNSKTLDHRWGLSVSLSEEHFSYCSQVAVTLTAITQLLVGYQQFLQPDEGEKEHSKYDVMLLHVVITLLYLHLGKIVQLCFGTIHVPSNTTFQLAPIKKISSFQIKIFNFLIEKYFGGKRLHWLCGYLTDLKG